MAALQNQSRPLCNANDLPNLSKEFWTVVIQVLRKDEVKTSKNGKKYQGYVLTDMEGTIIGAVSYEPIMNKFNRLLEPYERYYFSNALIKPAHPDYQPSDYPHGWTLTNQTHIEHIQEELPYSIPCPFNFVRFSDLPKWIDHTERIAIRCLIVHAIPSTDDSTGAKQKSKYVVIDEDGIPMMLTAWEDLVDNTQSQLSLKLPEPSMFVFINVKVSTRYGLSLATQNCTSAFYDPPLSGQSSLIHWYQENTQLVATVLREEAYKNTDILMPFPKADQIITVAEALKVLDQIKVAWVAGNIYLIPAQEKFWYPACPSCYRSLNRHITWETICNFCGAKGTAIPRCRVECFLNDLTETMSITYFGEQAEELIGHTAVDLKAAPEKHRVIEKELEVALYKKPATCFVKSYDKTVQGANVRTHTVIKMYTGTEPTLAANQSSETMSLETPSVNKEKATTESTPKQFFSPTTKAVLEEITTHTSTDESASMIPISSKRSLFQAIVPVTSSETHAPSTLQTVPSKIPAQLPSNDPKLLSEMSQSSMEPDGNKLAVSTAMESPIKKTKNKEKEC